MSDDDFTTPHVVMAREEYNDLRERLAEAVRVLTHIRDYDLLPHKEYAAKYGNDDPATEDGYETITWLCGLADAFLAKEKEKG